MAKNGISEQLQLKVKKRTKPKIQFYILPGASNNFGGPVATDEKYFQALVQNHKTCPKSSLDLCFDVNIYFSLVDLTFIFFNSN